MPFLAPALPYVIPGAKAVAGVVGGWLGKKAVSGLAGSAAGGVLASKYAKPSNEATAQLKTILDLQKRAKEQGQVYGDTFSDMREKMGEGINRGRFYLDEAGHSARQVPGYIESAEGQYDRAEDALKPSQDYWTNVLAGGPAAMQAISPEIQALRGQTNSLMSTVGQFAPRGGGRAGLMGVLPYQNAAVISNMLSQARGAAAGALPQIAQIMTQIGAGRGDLAETQIQLSEMQRRIGATEAEIGLAAGRLGIQAGQLQALLLATELQGADAILRFDIQNRQILYQQVKEGAKAGGNIAKTLWDVITGMDWGGGGGGGTSSGNTLVDLMNSEQLNAPVASGPP